MKWARALLGAAILTMAAAPAANARSAATDMRDYYVVAVADDFVDVIDLASIHNEGGYVRFMSVLVYKEPQADEHFVALLSLTDADCAGKRKRSVTHDAYDAGMTDLGTTDASMEWSTPDAGTIGADELTYVCGDRGDTKAVIKGNIPMMRDTLINMDKK